MDEQDDIEPGGHEPESREAGMALSDRIILIGASVIVGATFIVAALLLKGVIVALTGIAGGVGLIGALPFAIATSVFLMVLFAMVAGDVVGELPTMLIGFFVMTAFFTVVIAVIY